MQRFGRAAGNVPGHDRPTAQTKGILEIMRAIAVALTAALLAGGAALAHGRTTADAPRSVGTMTCHVRGDVSLVFGRSPVADCTFVSDRDGLTQSYAAIFGRGRDVPKAQTLTWRVGADDGIVRADMLNGRFALTADAAALAKAGGAVTLTPMRVGAQARPALDRPTVEFAAQAATLASR